MDNILFSHELLKWYTRKGLSPRCVMNVYLRKAYESIVWSFIKMMMSAFGFPRLFYQLGYGVHFLCCLFSYY